MNYHLERKIRLSEDSEYRGLYPWSLQEINENGEQVGKDQIPWAWSLYFTATELSQNYSVDIEKSYKLGINEITGLTQENEVITAVLKGSLEDNISYSMFGTARVIHQFGLRIHKLEENSDLEKCCVWGCASYTSEIDFKYSTTNDVVIIHLYLSVQRFKKIAKLINAGGVDMLQVCIRGVSGFYSEWSPSISTNSIKILPDSKDQEVITQEGCQIEPFRLGDVSDFDMTVIQYHKLNAKHKLRSNNMDEPFEDSTDCENSPIKEESFWNKTPSILAQLTRNEAVLTKLVLPIWLIFIVLCIFLLK